MEIFGIGPLELILIVVIALIVLGPKDIVKSSQKLAEWIRKLRKSEVWNATKEVMDIPNQVMRETGLDKEIHELQSLTKPQSINNIWQPTSPSSSNSPQLPVDPTTPEKPAEADSTSKTDSSPNLNQDDQH